MREREEDQSGGGGLFGEAAGGEMEAGSYEATDRGKRGKEQPGSDAGTGRTIPRGTDEHADSPDKE